MKKVLIIIIPLLILSILIFNKDLFLRQNTILKTKDITGYFIHSRSDFSGNSTDLTNNAYLQITEDKLIFSSVSFKNDEDYISTEKYYILEDNKIYFNPEKLSGSNFKENIDHSNGGIFSAELGDNVLVLKEIRDSSANACKIDVYKRINYMDLPDQLK